MLTTLEACTKLLLLREIARKVQRSPTEYSFSPLQAPNGCEPQTPKHLGQNLDLKETKLSQKNAVALVEPHARPELRLAVLKTGLQLAISHSPKPVRLKFQEIRLNFQGLRVQN